MHAEMESRLAGLEAKLSSQDHMQKYTDTVRQQDMSGRIHKIEAAV